MMQSFWFVLVQGGATVASFLRVFCEKCPFFGGNNETSSVCGALGRMM
jgi:hypothetical protein